MCGVCLPGVDGLHQVQDRLSPMSDALIREPMI